MSKGHEESDEKVDNRDFLKPREFTGEYRPNDYWGKVLPKLIQGDRTAIDETMAGLNEDEYDAMRRDKG